MLVLCKDKKSQKHASISRAAYLQKSAHEGAKTIQEPLQRDAEASARAGSMLCIRSPGLP